MTLVIYEPEAPALEIIGHTGFEERGRDIVCAACSVLMYTLWDALPDIRTCTGDGFARLDGSGISGAEGSFRLIARGYKLLAVNYPEHVSYREKFYGK